MPSQNTIKCSRCGTAKGTTNVRLKKLIKQYGSQEKLEKLYVCRDCKSGTPKGGKGSKKKLPSSKCICSKCGNKFGTTKARMEKLIAQYGSLEEVHNNYVCRHCRKEHNVDRAGRPKRKKQPRKEKHTWERDKNGNIILPSYFKANRDRKPVPLTAEQLGSNRTCWRPDIYCLNAKHCNGPHKECPHFGKESCGSHQDAYVGKKIKVKKTKKTKKTKKKKQKK